MRTVKIRIPVAVDPQGRWYAHGWSTGDASGPKNHDELLEITDLDSIGPNEKLYWLHAELVVPEIENITTEISKDHPHD